MNSETTPLLSPDNEEENDSASQAASPTSETNSFTPSHLHWKKWRTLYLSILFLVSIDFSGNVAVVPIMRLLEDLVCQHLHGPSADNPNQLCRLPDVQEHLARVRGTLSMLEFLPGFILGIPYGIMADIRGRRFVLATSIVGVMLSYSWSLLVFSAPGSFPLWSIYLSPLFLCIGGGAFVIGAVLMAIVASVVPTDLRTNMFFLLGILNLVTSVVVSPFGAWIMDRHGALFTYALAIPILFVPLFTLIFIPNTNVPPQIHHALEQDETEESNGRGSPRLTMVFEAAKRSVYGVVEHVQHDILPMLTSRAILYGLLSILFLSFSESSGDVLLQYMRVRFGWRYEIAVSILAFQAFAHIIALCTVMPLLHSFLLRHLHDPEKANLAIMKICVIFHIGGTALLGFSSQPAMVFIAIAISMIGSGFGAATRSFLTSLVPKNETAVLYTMFSMFASLGFLFGAPLLSYVFAFGIRLGGWLLGLPFFLATFMFVVCAGLVWSIHVRERYDSIAEESDRNS